MFKLHSRARKVNRSQLVLKVLNRCRILGQSGAELEIIQVVLIRDL